MNELLCMTSIEKYIPAIFPMELKLVPEHSARVALRGRGTEAYVTTIQSRKATVDDENEHATILVAKLIPIPAKEPPIVVVASKYGLMTIERIQTEMLTHRILPGRGIH